MDLRLFISRLKDIWNRKQIKKQHEYAKELAFFSYLAGVQAPIDPPEHVLHKTALISYVRLIKNYTGKTIRSIAFGDSILDIPKSQYKSVPQHRNFALSGSWAQHMAQMARDLKPYLSGFYVENVIVGCLGGNPLLAGQPIEHVISTSQKALKEISELYPSSKLVVYGLPPVYNLNVAYNSIVFEVAIYQWLAGNHGNFVFIPMQKQFAGLLGLFPTIKMSSDGVHLSNAGVVTLDRLFARGFDAMPLSVIE